MEGFECRVYVIVIVCQHIWMNLRAVNTLTAWTFTFLLKAIIKSTSRQQHHKDISLK